MPRSQSPGYPNLPLEQALIKARSIFDEDRTNIIDREVAAKHLGYSGLSGASDKALSTLSHYGLLERAGKGQTKLTSLAMKIFAPTDDDEHLDAIHEAGNLPSVFDNINEHFESEPSDEALKNWLIREGFKDSAIKHVMKSYTGTMLYLKQQGASESSSPYDLNDAIPPSDQTTGVGSMEKDQREKPKSEGSNDFFGVFSPKPAYAKGEGNDFTIVVDGLQLQIQCKNVNASGLGRLIQELEMYKGILTIREKAAKGESAPYVVTNAMPGMEEKN